MSTTEKALAVVSFSYDQSLRRLNAVPTMVIAHKHTSSGGRHYVFRASSGEQAGWR